MPCSFTDALCTKYGEEIMEGLGTACEIFVVGSAPSRSTPDGKFLMVPKSLTLNNCGISVSGSHETINEICHDIEELDLAQNQLCDLIEIDNIISQMSKLWFLNLSHNDLEDTEPAEMTPTPNMRSLVLNHTHITWGTMSCFLDAMPNLQELHISLNNYDSVDFDLEKNYQNVKRLHINGNPIKFWEDVVHLGQNFPCLECLVMVDCAVETIPDPETWADGLPALRHLNINNGPLKDWDDIDRLNGIPQLEDIRVVGIPILEELKAEERRQHLIARLPKASKLNGSDISWKEREDSERAFIRYFLDKEERPKRFYDLEEVHGKLQPLVEIDFTVKKTAQVEVRFCQQMEIVTLDLYKTVQDLKVQLSPFCGLPPSKMRVFFVDREMIGCTGTEELRYNNKKLYTYRIQDGDEIIVDSK